MIDFDNVYRIYPQGKKEIAALNGLTLHIEPGEFVAVTGPSGSGKSTFLHLAGGLDLPTRGEVRFDGRPTQSMTDDALTKLRRNRIGFVFQFFNLIPTLSVLENTALPLLIRGGRLGEIRPKAEELLEWVGLSERITHLPEELSGGEIQRVAIARALVTDPAVLFADEPTGVLDSATGAEILGILARSAGSRTIVMVTHDLNAAASTQRVIHLKDGRVA